MSYRYRRPKPDTGIWPFRNRMEGALCAKCGIVITGTESHPGEIKAWQRIAGQSCNWHLACALALGKIVNRLAYEKILRDNPDLERVELPPLPTPEKAPEKAPVNFDDNFAPETDPEVDVDVPEVTPEPEPTPAPAPVKPPAPLPDWLQGFAQAVLPFIEDKIKTKADKGEIQAIVEKAVEKAKFPHVTCVRVIEPTTKQVTDLGVQHKMFPRLFSAVQAYGRSGKRNMVMMVGPTGSGKTTLAEKVAEALKVPYFHFGAMDTEYKMTGFLDAQGRIVSTRFRQWYLEKGGLALFDEMDSWFPNAQLSLNSLSNGYMSFPDGQFEGLPNRYLVAACNTWGFGADNDYVGRFKLDAAFLNRWNVKLHVDYDEDLERAIFGGDRWTRRVQELRARARQKGIKVIISPRASDTGYGLLNDGWPIEEVEEAVVRQGLKQSDWDSIVLPRVA